jgi:hypothetical protein
VTKVSAGPISFELAGEWSPASLVLIAPRVDAPTLMTAKQLTQYRANLVVQSEPAEGLELARLVEVHRERLASSVADYELIAEEDVQVAGAPAVLREHRFVDGAGYHLQQLELFRALPKDRVLHALASDHRGGFEQHRSAFREALLSIVVEG